jgi:hypothetical protein
MALNTALKSGMFVMYHDPDDPTDEAMKLVREFETLRVDQPKRQALDDFIDTCRYALMDMPIDWDAVLNGKVVAKKQERPKNLREGEYERFWDKKEDEEADRSYIDEEFEEWADLY